MTGSPEPAKQGAETTHRPETENSLVVPDGPPIDGEIGAVDGLQKELDDCDLDFTTPYQDRDEAFNKKREQILVNGVGAYSGHSLRFFDALSDMSSEVVTALDSMLAYVRAEMAKARQQEAEEALLGPAVERAGAAAAELLAIHKGARLDPEGLQVGFVDGALEETMRRLIAEVRRGTDVAEGVPAEMREEVEEVPVGESDGESVGVHSQTEE